MILLQYLLGYVPLPPPFDTMRSDPVRRLCLLLPNDTAYNDKMLSFAVRSMYKTLQIYRRHHHLYHLYMGEQSRADRYDHSHWKPFPPLHCVCDAVTATNFGLSFRRPKMEPGSKMALSSLSEHRCGEFQTPPRKLRV